jgi:hypothetical protein
VSVGTRADEFREAVRRLHRAKDAGYRDAWKRRGEAISILANIARKCGPARIRAGRRAGDGG